MKSWIGPALMIIAASATLWASFAGCAHQATRSPALAQLQPETQQRMKLVMAKVGKYYTLLEESVQKGRLAEAATQADAIATLGTYLAPQRDPAVPPSYVALQAEFDAAARELAAAARLKSVQEVGQSFDELRSSCRSCHAAFGVRLDEPHRQLGCPSKGKN